MSESDALSITVRDGVQIRAYGIARERSGELRADLELRNGSHGYQDRGVLNTVVGRDSWAASAAARADWIDRAELEQPLLRLLEEAEALLQERAPPGQVDAIVTLFRTADSGVELFHDASGDAWATAMIDDHRETFRLDSTAFRRFMSHRYYRHVGSAPRAQALADAIHTLAGEAVHEGPEYEVATRVAAHEDAIFIDLCDRAWRAIRIDVNGWEIVDTPPVRFRRARGMLPLAVPATGGSIQDLRPFVNTPDPASFFLLVSAMVQAWRPEGPYPVLVTQGQQGSGKTILTRVFRRLIDPNSSPVRSEPRNTQDLMIAGTNAWVVSYDNLSHLAPWLSDALCRLSTGGGFAARELYTNAEEVLFEAQRPVLLNGIEEIATRADLLDRAVVLSLPAITADQRRPERQFWEDFERACPSILAALCDAARTALRDLPSTHVPGLPRMADFALWASAASSSFGWTADDFLSAYEGNRSEANVVALEASPIGLVLRDWLPEPEDPANPVCWDGTSTQLLSDLGAYADEKVTRQPGWPKNARSLSSALRRLQPNLEAIGITLTFASQNKHRMIHVERRSV